jgi:hypothetical protein
MDDTSTSNKADAFTSASLGIGHVIGNGNMYRHGVRMSPQADVKLARNPEIKRSRVEP